MRTVLKQDGENPGHGQAKALWHRQLAGDAWEGRVDKLLGKANGIEGRTVAQLGEVRRADRTRASCGHGVEANVSPIRAAISTTRARVSALIEG